MIILRIFIVLFLTLPLLNCKISLTGGNQQWEFHNLASIGDDEEDSDSDYFYIDLDTSYYKRSGFAAPIYEISTSEKFGDSDDTNRESVSNCEVRYDEDDPESTEDMMCIMDIMEQDFYTGSAGKGDRDLVLTYNVPGEMCSSLVITPSWHYNQRIGQGYKYIYKCKQEKTINNTEEGGTEEEKKETKDFTCAANSIPTTNEDTFEARIKTACEGSKPNYDQDGIFCSPTLNVKEACGRLNLDLTKIGFGNCCFGTYRDENGVSNSYNGDFKSCIGGPGRHSWDFTGSLTTKKGVTYDGVPLRSIAQVPEDGLKDTINIKRLLTVTQDKASFPITNYIKDLDVDSKDLRRFDEDDLPKIFQRPKDLPGAPPGEPLWTFSCLDSAGDTIHRLHLMIREWNTQSAFMDFYDSQGEEIKSGDEYGPNVKGIEGKDCDYEDRKLFGREEQCNDFIDLEDFFEDPFREMCEILGVSSDEGSTKCKESEVNDYPHIYYQ